jgi:hypothetical protein
VTGVATNGTDIHDEPLDSLNTEFILNNRWSSGQIHAPTAISR